MRQQPQSARSCGFGDKDRRVIDPPPIVELVVQGPDLTDQERDRYIRFDTYIVQCCIYDSTGKEDLSMLHDVGRTSRRLMGTDVAHGVAVDDEHGKLGCFFAFPDLSCRTGGDYRLSFALTMKPADFNPLKDKRLRTFPPVHTQVFTVYNAKDFPGMMPSSELAKTLQRQGLPISIKKGAMKPERKDGHDDDDGQDDRIKDEEEPNSAYLDEIASIERAYGRNRHR